PVGDGANGRAARGREVHDAMGTEDVQDGMKAQKREVGGDLRELERIAQEGPGEGVTARPVVAAIAVRVLEEDRRGRPPAGHDLRAEHVAGLGPRAAGLPDVLVDDAELVARPEVAGDVDVPSEDVR